MARFWSFQAAASTGARARRERIIHPQSFFLPDLDGFVATGLTRGPWSRDHQHGGPPAALMARAIEQEAGDGMRVARLTVLRPGPGRGVPRDGIPSRRLPFYIELERMPFDPNPERQGTVFEFEDLPDDLPRPPLAAMRFFRRTGVKIALKTWRKLPIDVRWAMAAEGSRDQVDETVSRALLRHVSLRELELIGDPSYSESSPVPGLVEALGMGEHWRVDTWPLLSSFQRFVLNFLAGNRRLLWRAFEEISGLSPHPGTTWRGLLARAEVQIRAPKEIKRDLLRLLVHEQLLEGRGLILARASGVRAARSANDIFDLYAAQTAGTIELDWRVRELQSSVLWQAHASTHDGEFFPAASLLAATTAAVCLYDMIKEFDPEANVQQARLVEEPWEVGRYEWDEATQLYPPSR